MKLACWRGSAACSTAFSRILQLTLMLFFAPLSTASAVAYEKDRRTFNLLLMTSLSDLEIVLGKLIAGLLNILIILGASMGLLSLCALLGGISFGQVASLFAVTAASGVAGGAMGLLIALWRDRTFQSISLTILMVVFSVAGVELFSVTFPTAQFMGVPIKEVLNPYRAMIAVLYPRSDEITGVVRASSLVYIGVRLFFASLIVAFGTWKLRVWNPGRNEPREAADEAETEVVETLVELGEAEADVEVPLAVGAGRIGCQRPSGRRCGAAEGPSLESARPGRSSAVGRDDRTDDGPARPAADAPAGGPGRHVPTARRGPTPSSGASS